MRLFILPVVALMSSLACATPGIAQTGVAGSYLAAQHASFYSDYRAAAQYYTKALARDPGNVQLMENAVLAFIGLGRVDNAVPVSRRLNQLEVPSQTADLVLLANLVKTGAFEEALKSFDDGLSVGQLADTLVKAWAEFGAGRMSEALAAFDAAAANPNLGLFGDYHKALALGVVGDFEGAAAIFDSESGDGMRYTRRGALANIAILSQLERNDDALALIEQLFGSDLDPGLVEVHTLLEAGGSLPFTTITSAADGVAEVFFTVAEAVNGEANDTYTLIYSRMAEFLRPEHVDAMLLSAEMLEKQQQYELATESYRKVPADDPAFYAAELGRAGTLEESGKPEAAAEVLGNLAKSYPNLPVIHLNLGNTLARLRQHEPAVRAFSDAIALYEVEEPSQWYVYYVRGISNERLGNWPEAEADFRKALSFQPDQPRVLNYLGYSLVEKQQDLDEALDMIERAVAGRPDDGYITDSLAWVLYRLGKYEEAVPHMERAVELTPIDPIINDHLGDVLWAVGRKLEAEFQWSRALSFVDPENTPPELDPDRIRRKLEVGLDRVLEEEGAEPLKVADDR